MRQGDGMTENPTHLTVTRILDVPAKDVFEVLTLPARHHEFDGSGTVRAADDTERVTASGQKFVMNMHREEMGGDYRTHNFVTAYDENKMIGWQPAPEAADGSAPEAPLGLGMALRAQAAGLGRHRGLADLRLVPRGGPEAPREGRLPRDPREGPRGVAEPAGRGGDEALRATV